MNDPSFAKFIPTVSPQKQQTTFPFITLITEAKNSGRLHKIKIAA
jgi:hypothetical protein